MNPDLLINLDLDDSIQGHVGPTTKQVFQTLYGVPFSHVKAKLTGYEFLLRDQFGNFYHKMRAVLFDGEMYDIDQFIKPSMMMKYGGGHADFEDKAAKARLAITEDLLKDLREQGALTLARTNLILLKERSLSLSPVAIETQDVTHQSNRLEDAIVAAKQAAGEHVTTDPIIPEVFVPLKADKVSAGEILTEVISSNAGLTLAPTVLNESYGHNGAFTPT